MSDTELSYQLAVSFRPPPRRVLLRDVLSYARSMRADRRKTLTQLTAEADVAGADDQLPEHYLQVLRQVRKERQSG